MTVKFSKKEKETLNRILGDRLRNARETLKHPRELKCKESEMSFTELAALKEEKEILAVFSKMQAMEVLN